MISCFKDKPFSSDAQQLDEEIKVERLKHC